MSKCVDVVAKLEEIQKSIVIRIEELFPAYLDTTVMAKTKFMSNKAFEVLSNVVGDEFRIPHVSFMTSVSGRISDTALLEQMSAHAVEEVNKIATSGDSIMWRSLPEFSEHNDKNPGWFDRDEPPTTSCDPDNFKVLLVFRLGVIPSVVMEEGYYLPTGGGQL